jgi:hypothetical protein
MVLKNEGSGLNRAECIGCEESKCTPARDLSFRAFVFLHCVAVIAGVLNHLTTVARTKAKKTLRPEVDGIQKKRYTRVQKHKGH